ncbi:MAG: phage tail tape measure protein [Leuconostoc pseudomesenteroides]|uniref:phage tail tape measure protein n=1 Tax=Leuconostoc pseudomesenteroides TaxID=33968 RepID=UPI0039E7D73E
MATYNGGEVIAHVGADISDYQSAMKSVSSSTSSAMGSASTAVGNIGKTLAVAGAAVTAVGIKSVNSFGTFQASLNKAAVIAGGTSKDIQGLADVANHMGAVLPLSAQDAADAMVAMARDGASIGTIKKEFPAIAEAATAAGADLQTTASVVQQSMNIWGDSLKSPQRAAAILTQTANLSNASIEDMQQALATIGGTASNAGIDMETTSTAIGLLTNKGFSAAQASQDLNHALLLMQAPSKMGKAVMDDLGVSMTDAQGNMKPLPTILNDLSDSMSNMTSSQKAAALKTMFGTSGMAAILPLMKSVKDKTDNATTSWDAFTKQMNTASSSTQTATKFLQDQAAEMQKNLGSSIEQVGGNWEALRNAAMAGSAGVIGSIIDMINNALEWATTTKSAFGNSIRTILGLTPVIGAATLATGTFLTAATKIGSVMKTVGTAVGALFTSPMGLAILAIGALAGALSLAYKYSKPFRDAIQNIGDAFNKVFNPATKKSSNGIKTFGDTVSNVMQAVGEAFGNKLANAINSVNWVKVFTSIHNVLASVLHVATNAVDIFGKLAVKVANSGAAAKSWDILKASLKGAYDVAKLLYDGVKNVYDELGKIGGKGSNVGKGLQSAFGVAALLSVPIGLKMMPKILGLILSPAKKLTGAFGSLLSNILPFGNKTKIAADAAGSAKKPFSSFATKVLEVGAGIGIAAGGLGVLAYGLSKLSSQGEQGTSTMKTFGVVVGALAAVFALFGRDLTAGAIGIGVLLGGITAAALAFTALASTGKQGQATMITFGVVIGALAAVFALLGPILTASAVGIAVFGAAVLAVGVGIGIASLGLATLITALNNTNLSFSQIVTTMGAVGVGFATMLTGFITTLASNMPIISQSLLNMLVQFLGQMITYTPILTQQLISILLGFINTITNNIVPIANSVTNLMLGMMTAIGDNAPQLVAGFAAMLGKLAEALIEIMPYIIQLTGAIIAGMIAAVATYVGAFNKIGGVILNALIAGVTGKKYDAVGAATDIINSSAKSASDNGVKAFNAAGGASAIASLNAISAKKSDAKSAGKDLGQSAADGVSSKKQDAKNAGSDVAQKVKDGVGSADLSGNGESVMGGFLNGLQGTNWGRVMGFVGSVAGWIAKHKGPISYDRKLLIPAGAAIMGGFGSSLNANFADVKKSVSSYAGQIADEFGQQKYVASAQLTANSTGVAGQINGGLASLSDEVAEQSAQTPVYEIHNEMVGDKITTTVNSKNARRQATTRLVTGGI